MAQMSTVKIQFYIKDIVILPHHQQQKLWQSCNSAMSASPKGHKYQQ